MRKQILFVMSVLALSIVVFNNFTQLMTTFQETGWNSNLLLSFTIAVFGSGTYILANIKK